MKDEVYTQCKLVKGNVIQVAFIPSHFAKVNEPIKIKNTETGEWDSGWVVTEVYQNLAKASVLTQERLYTKTRKTSDI